MEHVTWYATRSAGITAYLLLFLMTATGLMLSGGAAAVQRGVPVLALHRFFTYLAGGFLALHVLVLAFDSYLRFSIVELIVPFMAPYERWWTGVGVIALYMFAAVVLTTQARHRMSTMAWYATHLVSYPTFVFATAHGIMAGSDSITEWMFVMYFACAALTVLLFVERFASARNAQGSVFQRWAPGVLAGGAVWSMVILLLVARNR